ncbi:MAG: helix-turn-helix transcriptional regulator [Planctomycetales bacterium]|nr:MAG: helix-turn-helix transcriptional regulator [Planctomycetales bacterium]
MSVAEQVGMNIRVVRTRKKMSQAALSEASGIERHHLSDIELGKVNISLQTMARLCSALGCELADIVAGVKLDK